MQRLIKTGLSSNGCAELISIKAIFFSFSSLPLSLSLSLSLRVIFFLFPFFFFFFYFAVVRTNTDLWAALIRDHLPIVNIRSVKNVFLKRPPDNTENGFIWFTARVVHAVPRQTYCEIFPRTPRILIYRIEILCRIYLFIYSTFRRLRE